MLCNNSGRRNVSIVLTHYGANQFISMVIVQKPYPMARLFGGFQTAFEVEERAALSVRRDFDYTTSRTQRNGEDHLQEARMAHYVSTTTGRLLLHGTISSRTPYCRRPMSFIVVSLPVS